MNWKLGARTVFAVALACAGGVASAGSVTATLTGVAPGTEIVNVNFTNPYNSAGDPFHTFSGAVYAGELEWSGNSGNDLGLTNFSTYCIEFAQEVNFGQAVSYTLTNLGTAPQPFGAPTGNPANGVGGTDNLLSGSTRENLIRRLYTHYVDSGDLDDVFVNDGIANGIEKAAFQIAIWKIIYETDSSAYTSLTTGNITFSAYDGAFAQISSLASTYLTSVIANANSSDASWAPDTTLAALTNRTAQDQLLPVNDVTITALLPVPLPAAAGSGGVGLAMLLMRRRR